MLVAHLAVEPFRVRGVVLVFSIEQHHDFIAIFAAAAFVTNEEVAGAFAGKESSDIHLKSGLTPSTL